MFGGVDDAGRGSQSKAEDTYTYPGAATTLSRVLSLFLGLHSTFDVKDSCDCCQDQVFFQGI